MNKILFLVIIIYAGVTHYVINSYDTMNTKLLTVNTKLMQACTISPLSKPELDRYK